MGLPSKEMKELSAEYADNAICSKSLIIRTEYMLQTYRKNIGKRVPVCGDDPVYLRSRLMMYLSAIQDMRIPSDTKEFREAANYLSAAGYMDRLLKEAMEEVSLKRNHGDLYYDILIKKYGGSGMTKDYVIAAQLGLRHTSMCARKKEAILAVGIEMLTVTIPAALREVAGWGIYEKA